MDLQEFLLRNEVTLVFGVVGVVSSAIMGYLFGRYCSNEPKIEWKNKISSRYYSNQGEMSDERYRGYRMAGSADEGVRGIFSEIRRNREFSKQKRLERLPDGVDEEGNFYVKRSDT